MPPLAAIPLLSNWPTPSGVWAVASDPAAILPWVVVIAGMVTVALLLAHFADLLVVTLLWLAVASIFPHYFWTLVLPGFFNLSIDRLGMVMLVGVFVIGLMIGRFRLTWPGVLGAVVAALVVWTGLSAQLHGWTLPPAAVGLPGASPPYYLFFVGYLFPAIVFLLVVSAVRQERHLESLLWFFCLFGLYLTVVGLGEFFHVGWLVWPKFILDPNIGIHIERVRGPFLSAPAMGMTLVAVLFANLLLMARGGHGRRLLLILACLPLPLLIFATYTRSVWLATLLCSGLAIWFWPRGRAMARALAGVALAALIVLTFLLWPHLTGSERRTGGVAAAAPAIARYELALVSLDLARAHPVTGVGLGRFFLASSQSQRLTNIDSRGFFYARYAVEHNNFLGLLAETGLPGAALYVLLVVGVLVVSIRLYRLLPPTAVGILDRRFVVFYWILWVDYVVDAMLRQTTFSAFPNSMFLAASGVIVAIYHRFGPWAKGLRIDLSGQGSAGRSARSAIPPAATASAFNAPDTSDTPDSPDSPAPEVGP